MKSFVTIAVALIGAFPASAGADQVSGTSLTALPVGTLSWSDMLRIDAQRADQPSPAVIPAPHMPVPLGGELLVGPPAPGTSPAASVEFARGVCPSLMGEGIIDSFLAIDDQGFAIPPDTMGAVGPNHLVTMLNDRVRIEDRAGGVVSTVFLSTFWSPAAPVNPFDPTVVYDELAGHFIACCDSARRTSGSAVLFAISQTSDPTGAWDFYSLDADPTNMAWADFPRMGYNTTWVAITNNMFANAGDAFQGVSMWVISAFPHPPGGAIGVTLFDYGFDVAGGVYGVPLVPACTHDPAETTLWIIDATGFTSGGTQLHRISRVTDAGGGTPVWSVVPGGIFPGTGLFAVPPLYNYSSFTPRAAQLGTATLIATNDARPLDAEVRGGGLWYTLAGGVPATSPTRTSVFWYLISPTALPSPFVQLDVIDAPGEYFFFPSLAVNCANDMMIGFSHSSASIYVEAAFAYRLGSDSPGTTRPVQTIKAGEDSYVKDWGSGSVRWGDYSATVVDPKDDLCMWTIQEYARLDIGPTPSDDRWGIWWASLCAIAPCPGDIDGDSDTDVFDFGIFATNFETSVPPFTNGDLDGSGFVDVFDFAIFAPDFGCVP